MRNLTLAVLFFASSVFVAKAQGDMSFGVKAGVNISGLVDSDIYGDETKAGWTAGLVIEVPITDKFSIQPEVLYSLQGAKSEYSLPYGINANASKTIETDITLQYVNVPVYAKYYIFDEFSVFLGPQFTFLVDNEIEITETIPLIPRPSVFKTKDKLNNSKNFGIDASVGLGYKFDFGVFVQGVYNYGFYKIVSYDDAKNSIVQFSLGYEF